MDIGKPERVIIVEPLADPVPAAPLPEPVPAETAATVGQRPAAAIRSL